MLDPARLELLAAELLAVAGELRAAERENAPNGAFIEQSTDEWLTEAQTAAMAGITASGMAKHRHRKSSPAYRTVHGRPMYRRSAVLAWIEHRKRQGIVRLAGLGPMEGGDGEA